MNKGKKVASELPGSFTWGKKITWALRSLSTMMCAIVIGYVTYYGTNILGIPAAIVGMLIFASKMLDAVSDLIGGYLVDKTHTKLGKARPYELAIIGMWASTVIMFACPDLGMIGKCLWIFTWYTLICDVFFTMLNAAEPVYMIRAIPNRQDLEKTASLNGITSILGAMIVSVAYPLMMGSIGKMEGGWTIMALIFAIPMTLIGLMRFFLIPEVRDVQTEKKEKLTVAEIKEALTSNRYIYLYILVILLVNLMSGFSNSMTYYFDYIVGSVEMMSLASLPGMVMPFALLFFPLLLKKHTVVGVSKVCLVIGIIGCVIKQFAGADMGLILIGSFVSAVGTLPLSAFTVILLTDTMDYNEWRTNKRVEGIYSAMGSFGQKLGSGFASALSGLLLGISGFISSAENVAQPDSALAMIRAQFGLVPGLILVLLFVVLMFFDVEKKMPQIQADLKARKAEAGPVQQ